MASFPLTLPALKVSQPLGEFFAVILDAATLRQVTFLDATRVDRVDAEGFWYSLLGAQRPPSLRRAKQIANYINTVEAAFPNSIILAANYINYGELQENDDERWRVEVGENSLFHLVIPSDKKMASIIDGQHRLMGFDYCEPEKKTTQLLCSVYMDLPHSYQAYLFATININQRKVDKSLAYDQFGYNVDDEERSGWAPDKLAVFFTRRLNLDPESPFYGRIKVAPLNAELLFPEGYIPDWQVSTACVVEGIVKLISQNSKADRDLLHKKVIGSRSRSQLPKDSSPMRGLYLAGQDEKLYHQIEDFFKVAKDNLWVSATQRSYIRKTVGIQALFDVLRSVVENTGRNPAVSETNSILGSSSGVDFSDPVFQASGKGRVLIRNTILLYADLIPSQALPDQDRKLYLDLLKKYPKPKNGGQ